MRCSPASEHSATSRASPRERRATRAGRARCPPPLKSTETKPTSARRRGFDQETGAACDVYGDAAAFADGFAHQDRIDAVGDAGFAHDALGFILEVAEVVIHVVMRLEIDLAVALADF